MERQISFISRNNPENARKFKNALLTKIRDIPSNPYHFRKSIYFNDPSIRDLVFKGYTIVFRISDQFEVFGLVKFQDNPTD
jgi:plasmid stabilization system protein ParE